MPEIKLKKRDIAWSYLAQFLSMGVGVITLPFILSKLSAEEIGVNYILITVGSIIALVDLGFAPQFARNFTYVFSGAQELKKIGIGRTDSEINYELLAYLLRTARILYLILALFAFVLLLLIGTPYLYKTTEGFTNVPNVVAVWIIYSLGIIFQIYYSYYFSMLLGAGKVKEQKKAIIGNKILYMIILIGGLYANMGLLSVALAQMISPFLGRWMSYRYFYTDDLRQRFRMFKTFQRKRIIEIFHTLWFNAKRTAVMSIGAYAIIRFSMFIAGLYLTLDEFASYGLMTQLVGILGTVGCTYIQISQPKLASLRTTGQTIKLLSDFSLALTVYYFVFIVGSIVLILWGYQILSLIKSNVILPNRMILLLYCIVMFLEYNHTNFAILISSNNKVPFAPASIITGIAVCLGSFLVLKYSNLGILGLIIVQGVCQLAYQNWKWPKMALDEFNTSYIKLLSLGIQNMKYSMKKI